MPYFGYGGVPLRLKHWLIHGFIITLLAVVTIVVLMIVVEFILGMLSPLITAVACLWSDEPPAVVMQATTVLSLIAIFILIGLIADLTPGEHVSRLVEKTLTTIPGLGTVYTSVRRASRMVVDDDTEQFQDVKLIEFPHENAYMASFLIGEAPAAITDGLEVEEMVTVMVPLGPNPTTNGFVMHMPAENVHDVDLTVEEAIQTIATLGVDEVDQDRGT